MRNHRRVASIFGHFDRVQRLAQRADLIELDQNRIGDIVVDTALQDCSIGHEQVVAHQLYTVTNQFGQGRPAVPVALVHTIFNRDDRVALSQAIQIGGKARRIKFFAFTAELVFAVFVKL